MKIKVIRRPNDKGTPGRFSVDGANKWRSLELYQPKVGEPHIKGACCVPIGVYSVIPRFEGSVFGWMKDRVPAVAEYGIPHIVNIPGVDYPLWCKTDDGTSAYGIDAARFVLIHIGNKLTDTQGCCLVGMTQDSLNTIAESTKAFSEIYEQIKRPMRAGELTIEYV